MLSFPCSEATGCLLLLPGALSGSCPCAYTFSVSESPFHNHLLKGSFSNTPDSLSPLSEALLTLGTIPAWYLLHGTQNKCCTHTVVIWLLAVQGFDSHLSPPTDGTLHTGRSAPPCPQNAASGSTGSLSREEGGKYTSKFTRKFCGDWKHTEHLARSPEDYWCS